jgi:hypothetical protein
LDQILYQISYLIQKILGIFTFFRIFLSLQKPFFNFYIHWEKHLFGQFDWAGTALLCPPFPTALTLHHFSRKHFD